MTSAVWKLSGWLNDVAPCKVKGGAIRGAHEVQSGGRLTALHSTTASRGGVIGLQMLLFDYHYKALDMDMSRWNLENWTVP